MTIHVSSSSDKPTAQQQIEAAIAAALAASEPVRLRVVVQVYDRTDRNYDNLREAAYYISLPSATATGEGVASIVETVAQAIRALATQPEEEQP